MVKKVNSRDDITTWAEGKEKGYKTYGEFGDVIIYDKNGKGGTPVIHRAIVHIQVNKTRESGDPFTFDVPEWGIYNQTKIEYDIPELNLQINYQPPSGHEGYLTKGDNRATNADIDQESSITDNSKYKNPVEQVLFDWVLGVARGEIPWFGLIKLKLNENPNIEQAPDNSWTNLKISLFLLIGVPIILNVMYYAFAKKYGTLDEDEKSEKRKGGETKQLSKRHEKVQLSKKGRG